MEYLCGCIKSLTDVLFHGSRQIGISIAVFGPKKETTYVVSGYAGKNNRMDLETGFQVASLSKPVTAWGVMKLVESSILDLDTDVNQYLKRWQFPAHLHKPLTIRHLLSHTALLQPVWYLGTTEITNMQDALLQSVEKHTKPVKGHPRLYRYSGAGYTVLQLLIEDVTGLDFETYMQSSVLMPLEMTRSTFSNIQALQPNLARGHLFSRWPLQLNRYVEMGAAGLCCTIKDYVNFLYANLEMESEDYSSVVLHKATVRQMHQRVSREIPYGLGFAIKSQQGMRFSTHIGVNPGWRSCFILAPNLQKGILILTNFLFSQQLINKVIDVWLREELRMDSHPGLAKKLLA